MENTELFAFLIGFNVKRIREEQGLTLEELGRKYGAGSAYIWQIESGRRTLGKHGRAKMCKALGVELGELLKPIPKEVDVVPTEKIKQPKHIKELSQKLHYLMEIIEEIPEETVKLITKVLDEFLKNIVRTAMPYLPSCLFVTSLFLV